MPDKQFSNHADLVAWVASEWPALQQGFRVTVSRPNEIKVLYGQQQIKSYEIRPLSSYRVFMTAPNQASEQGNLTPSDNITLTITEHKISP